MPEAAYTIDLPTHPPVAWDKGFSVTKHSPRARDYTVLAEWAALLTAGEAGELEAAGLAYGYMNYSTLQRTVRWTDTSAPVLAPTSGRSRQPQDNRRLRNRL